MAKKPTKATTAEKTTKQASPAPAAPTEDTDITLTRGIARALTPDQRKLLLDELQHEPTDAPVDKLADDIASIIVDAQKLTDKQRSQFVAYAQGYDDAQKENDAAIKAMVAINYNPRQADPTYDPAPWFTSFGNFSDVRPYDKHHLGEAAAVVGYLVSQGIINLIPPQGLRGLETGADLCEAIIMVSRGMWHVRHSLPMSDFAYEPIEPNTEGEED